MWLNDEQRLRLAGYATRQREAVGLSVTEAAREAGVSWQFLKKIERGAFCTIFTASIESLAKVYQCDVDEFCRLAGVIPEDIEKALLEPGAFAAARRLLRAMGGIEESHEA